MLGQLPKTLVGRGFAANCQTLPSNIDRSQGIRERSLNPRVLNPAAAVSEVFDEPGKPLSRRQW